MYLLLVLFYIFCIAAAFSLFFRRRMEETFAPTIFLSIIVLYICGILFSNLMSGVIICWIIAAAGLMYIIFFIYKNKVNSLLLLLTPGSALYLLFSAIIWLLNGRRIFSVWDEFSHWGTTVYNMEIFDRLGNCIGSSVVFRGYPPGTALWQYFITKLTGSFSESAVYIATNLLILAICIPVAKYFSWKKSIPAFLTVLAFITAPMIFNNEYLVQIYVDIILGILMGYILIINFDKKDKIFDNLCIILAFSVLCLTKATGFLLSFIVLLIIVASDYVKTKKVKMHLSAWLSMLAVIMMSKISWDVYLKVTDTAKAWNSSGVTLTNIISLLHMEGVEDQYTTIHNFIEALCSINFSEYIFNLNYITLCALFLILLFIIYRNTKDMKIIVYGTGLFAGLGIYTVGLLVVYLFTFSSYEATNLASFTRYLGTYFVAMTQVILFIIIKNLNVRDKTLKMSSIGIIWCIILLLMPITSFYTIADNKERFEIRAQYTDVLKYKDLLETENATLSIISQNSTGYDFWHIRFLLTPINIPITYCWSLGTPYYEGDIWTCNISCAEWIDHLCSSNIDYVYLYKVDEQFVNEFGKAFAVSDEIDNNTLYKMDHESKILQRVVL